MVDFFKDCFSYGIYAGESVDKVIKMSPSYVLKMEEMGKVELTADQLKLARKQYNRLQESYVR